MAKSKKKDTLVSHTRNQVALEMILTKHCGVHKDKKEKRDRQNSWKKEAKMYY